jgi:hypothetical protein
LDPVRGPQTTLRTYGRKGRVGVWHYTWGCHLEVRPTGLAACRLARLHYKERPGISFWESEDQILPSAEKCNPGLSLSGVRWFDLCEEDVWSENPTEREGPIPSPRDPRWKFWQGHLT